MYSVPNGKGNLIQVCKNTFMNIYDVGHKQIEVIICKKKQGDINYTYNRKPNSPPKYTDDDEWRVRNHINSLPRNESHYSRGRFSTQFLSPDLNIHRLSIAFNEKFPDNKVGYKFYKKIFKKYFPDLKFHHPRVDTCKTCDKLQYEIRGQSSQSVTAKQFLEVHQHKAESATNKMKADIALAQLPGSQISTISMDLQQVLSVPNLTHSEMFYRRQLSCYNFCVSLGDTQTSYMCLWHEGIANRGGNEIASCLLRIINLRITDKRNCTCSVIIV